MANDKIKDKIMNDNFNNVHKFLSNYNLICPINIDKAYAIIKNTISYYIKSKDYNPDLKYPKILAEKWYDSLKDNKIDYSVYNDEYYFTDLWSCWKLFSRMYLFNLTKKNSLAKNDSIYDFLKNINSVLDLGCGIGYTTIFLKHIFKNAKVYGTNLKSTKQYKFCEFMSEKYDFNIVNNISQVNSNIDFVFASEYFEHIEFALNHLEDTINLLHPTYFYIANSFNTYSVGHFYYYKQNNPFFNDNFIKIYEASKVSRIFNKILRSYGYKKIKTNLWNNRPMLWMKQ